MGGGFFQSTTAPVLLYFKDEDNSSFPFTGEFRKSAPYWEVTRVHGRLAVMRHFADGPTPQAFLVETATLDEADEELLDWVKSQPQLRFLPIIVLSNSSDPALRQRCVALGVASCLDKPRSLKEMRNTIQYIAKLCEEARFHSQEWQEMTCV